MRTTPLKCTNLTCIQYINRLKVYTTQCTSIQIYNNFYDSNNNSFSYFSVLFSFLHFHFLPIITSLFQVLALSYLLPTSISFLAVDEWKRSKKLRFLGVPNYIAHGLYERGRDTLRFLVMPRFGRDLHAIWEGCGKSFKRKTVSQIALQLVIILNKWYYICIHVVLTIVGLICF